VTRKTTSSSGSDIAVPINKTEIFTTQLNENQTK